MAAQAPLAYTPYVAEGPATITLITSINGRSNSGAHSALVINGSERVLYDPAGSWALMDGMAPERDDMHFGMFPAALDNYIAFQSNGIFYATEQTIVVPLAVADQAIAAANIQDPGIAAWNQMTHQMQQLQLIRRRNVSPGVVGLEVRAGGRATLKTLAVNVCEGRNVLLGALVQQVNQSSY
jgi:hypothetical protein